MSTTLRDIYTALSAAVSTAAGSIPVAWENTKYEPIAGTPFIESKSIADDITPASLGVTGLNLHRGMLRIDAVYPVFAGNKVPLQTLDVFRTTFARGTRLTSNGITVTIESTSTAGSISDKVWIRYPLFVTWRCHVLD